MGAGADGVMHYQWAPFDGLDYQRISEASALLADHEAFFTDGERADDAVQSSRPGSTYALRHDGRLLVLMMNAGAEPQAFRVTVPGATGAATEYYSGAEHDATGEMALTVPGFDVAALVVDVG